MTQQYLRDARLTLGDPSGKDLDVSELRFTFQIQHSTTQTLKNLYARIYNMAPATIATAPREGGTVTLQAGYQGRSGVIFTGQITQTRVGRETPTDTCFDVFAQDGDTAYNQATVNASLAAGATAADVRAQMLKSFGTYGFGDGTVPDLSTVAMPRGQVFYGMTRDHMRVLARDNACTWGLEDERMNMVSATQSLPNTAVVLTAATGLIGLPQQTEDGISICCLLNPMLRINGLVQLDNSSIQQARKSQNLAGTQGSTLPSLDNAGGKRDGVYKIIWIDYKGDTRGQDWYCDLVCLTTDPNGIVPASVAHVGL